MESTKAKFNNSEALDILSFLNQKDGTFAAREQQVADFVKANLETIPNMNIADVAIGSNVSTPTVIRFCRTLGCEGFREFKIQFAQNLAVSLQYLSSDVDLEPLEGDSALDKVLGGLYAAANITRKQVDFSLLENAKSFIASSRQLLTSGIGGGSAMVAREAENRFFRLGIGAYFVEDSYLLQMRAATLGPEDVLLLVSASGEADEIVNAAKIARSYGATTICLTKANTRLAQSCHISIVLDLPEDPHVFKPTASRYVYLAIIDALALMVAQHISEKSNENLRRIRASLTAFHGRTGPQPLGD
jgi:DNA-binding MurR/RpiR family transcriptional regulator